MRKRALQLFVNCLAVSAILLYMPARSAIPFSAGRAAHFAQIVQNSQTKAALDWFTNLAAFALALRLHREARMRERFLRTVLYFGLVLAVAAGWRSATWRGRLVACVGTAIIAGFQVVARPDGQWCLSDLGAKRVREELADKLLME